ncbi:MAG: helix-turn-helix transcriptional regulator [Planctomycetales bacterium]|jgi:predicted DNA-binding transcriptional regulator AlpA
MSDTAIPSVPDCRLINITELAKITGLSKPTLWRHHDTGLIPAGCKIGRAVRWRLADIACWIETGCPRRDDFNRQEHASLSRREGVGHGE